MQTIQELLEALRQGTVHVTKMAEKLDFPWSPKGADLRKLHNVYVRNLITSYVSKFAQLSEAILYAVDNSRYLIYAQSGRALIEFTATLQYYILHQYKPLMVEGSVDMEKLIETDDRHLRGGRFNWEAFLFERYDELKADSVAYLENKKAKRKHVAQGIIAEQVNVLTCIEKWAEEETPKVLIAYNLFCDLVHPNIGSSFLVASTNSEGLCFSPYKGKSIGKDIFERSLPILIEVTQKPFGN